jgi:hypothetical protein
VHLHVQKDQIWFHLRNPLNLRKEVQDWKIQHFGMLNTVMGIGLHPAFYAPQQKYCLVWRNRFVRQGLQMNDFIKSVDNILGVIHSLVFTIEVETLRAFFTLRWPMFMRQHPDKLQERIDAMCESGFWYKQINATGEVVRLEGQT